MRNQDSMVLDVYDLGRLAILTTRIQITNVWHVYVDSIVEVDLVNISNSDA